MAIKNFRNIERESNSLGVKIAKAGRLALAQLAVAAMLFGGGFIGNSVQNSTATQQAQTTSQVVEYVNGDSNDLGSLEGPARVLAADMKAHVNEVGSLDGFVGSSGKYTGISDALTESPFQETTLCSECGRLSNSFEQTVESGEVATPSTSGFFSGMQTLGLGMATGTVLMSYPGLLYWEGRKIEDRLRPVMFGKRSPYIPALPKSLLRVMFVKGNKYDKEITSKTAGLETSLVDALWIARDDERHHVEDYVSLYDRITATSTPGSTSDGMVEVREELKIQLDSFDAAVQEVKNMDRRTQTG